MKKEKAAIAAVKVAQANLASAEATLATMELDTQTPFMDSFLTFFKKYHIQRLAYFGGTVCRVSTSILFALLHLSSRTCAQF